MSLVGVLITLMGIDIVGDEINQIMGTLLIICLAIGGFTLFTTKIPVLIEPSIEEKL
ncbi:MAG: hypothetical protein HGA76_08195 [Candidatus Firestonebacteria bacterium]|nr:hypothetical protein [Candidatus Firestonebacteria bacterium]